MTMWNHLLRKLADTLQPRIEPARTVLRYGTVKTVVAGGSVDGNAQVTVTINGNDLLATYREGYAPTVGHEVAVFLTDGSPFIVGRRIGKPTF